MKEACTVVLHSGLCPSHTQPPPSPPTYSPPPLPCSIKNKAISELRSSHAPPPSAPSTCLGSKEAVLPGRLVQSSRDSSRPYSLRQNTFTTAASGHVDLQAQKSSTHTHTHTHTHISLPNLTVCVTLVCFHGVTL